MEETKTHKITDKWEEAFESKKKEEELRENEEIYRTLFESSRDAIYILEQQTKNIKDANPAACELYGYTLDEMKKLNVMDITAEPEKTKDGIEKGIIWIPIRYHRKKDGTIFPIEISIGKFTLKGKNFNVVYVRDVTDRNRIQNQLIHDASFPKLNPNPIFEIDFSFNITLCNPAAQQIIEQIGADDASILFPEDIKDIIKSFETDKMEPIHREISVKDLYFEERITFAPGYDTVRFYCRDITDQKKAEIILKNYQTELEKKVNQRTAELIKVNEELKKEIIERCRVEKSLKASQVETLNEKNRLEVVMNTLPVGIAILDAKGGNIRTTDEFERILGEKKIIPKPADDYLDYKAWWVESGKPVLKEEWASALALNKGESVVGQVFRIQKIDGTFIYVHNSAAPIKDNEDNITGCVVAIQDITNYMNAEEEMRKSEAKLSALYSSMTEGVALHEIIYDDSGKPVDYLITDVNPAFEIITGLSRDTAIFKRATELYGTNEPPYFDIYYRVTSSGHAESFETYFAPMKKHFRISVFTPGKDKFATVFEDITIPKIAEEELHKMNRTLKAMEKSSQIMIRAKDELVYLNDVCKNIIEECGYSMMWIGYAENDLDKSVKPVAYSGFEDGYLETLKITWADTERGRGPTGTAIRTGKPVMCKNMLTDPKFTPWREEAIKRGYASSLVLPLFSEGKVFGAISIYSKKYDPFTDSEITLLSDLANDLSYGINSIRLNLAKDIAQEALSASERELRQKTKLLEHAPVLVRNMKDEIIMWNSGMEKLYGFKSADAIGKISSDLFQTKHPLSSIELQEIIKNKGSWEGELNHKNKRGQSLWVKSLQVLHKNDAGKPVAVIEINNDITVLKELEEELKKSKDELEIRVKERTAELVKLNSTLQQEIAERKQMQESIAKREKELRTLFEILPVGVSIIDENRKITNSNPALLKILGLTEENILKGEHLLRQYLNSDFTPITDDEMPSKMAVIEHAITQDSELGIIKENGEIIWTSISAAPLSDSSAVVVIADITERKKSEVKLIESESKLKEAQKLAKIGSWSWDVEKDIIIWSDELYNIFGRDKELPTPNYSELSNMYTKESWEMHNMAVGKTIEEGVSYDIELEFIRNDNKKHGWLNAIGKVEKDNSGKIIRLIGTAQDITERKIAENKLKQAEINWRETFNSISDRICLLDKNGTILQCNASLCDMFKLPADKLNGKKCYEVMHDCNSFIHNCPYVDMIKSGKREMNEQIIEGRYHAVTVDPIFNESGEIQGAVHIMRDITARKKAEEQLQSASLYARSLIEASLDPLVTINTEGKITDVNKATEKATGFIREKLIGTDFSNYFTDKEKARRGYQKVLKESMVRDFPLTIRHVSGKTTDVSYNAVVFRNDKGELQGVFAAACDITEMKLAEFAMKESEKKYRTLFEEAVDGIAMMDSKSFILMDCNKALCNLLEMDKDELINKSHNIIHPAGEEFMKVTDLKKRTLNDEHILETKVITKKGVIKDVEIKASTLKLKDKKFTLGIYRDVTARKIIEKQLIYSQNQLRELANHLQSVREEERKGLSRSLHDNFGQSLTGLKMGVFSLQKKLLKLDELSDDNEIFGNIKSMINLIDELIILTGKLSMDLRPNVLDMLGIKAAIEWLVNDYSSKTGIEFKLNSKIDNIDLNPEHSTEVFRILQEALTNVIRHANATRVNVNISVEKNDYIIEVNDNGKGITESEISSMLSMGILSMRERAILFGGDIELSGKKGKGTILSIKIPISKK